jgi:adenylate kinase family enzyme
MWYRRIHILGTAGSGKSHVAAKLSERYGIKTYDLDDIFWDNRAGGYGVMADPEERDEALEAIITQDAWIVEGAYCRWVFRSFEEADIVIILTTPRWLCEWRIVIRFFKRKLRLIPAKKKETVLALWRLLKWNHRYESDSLPYARDFLDILDRKAAECKTLNDVFRALETSE